MRYLNNLIDKRHSINISSFFIDTFNVKKFCKMHGYCYSEIPSCLCYDHGIFTVEKMHDLLKQVVKFTDEVIVVHLEYSEEMNDNELSNLLLDTELDKHFILILTNNNGVNGLSKKVTDLAINYKPKKTGYLTRGVSKKIKTILSN